MQNEDSPENTSFESAVLKWSELNRQVKDLVREKTRGSKDWLSSTEAIYEILELTIPLLELEKNLIEKIEGSDVIDCLSNPQIRSAVLDLVEKSRGVAEEELDKGELEMDDDLANEAWDFVYSFGTPKELVLRYRSLSSIVAVTEIPERVSTLVREAKTCYVMGQYIAVMSLGRMMLEYAITDIGVRRGLFPAPDSLEDFYKAYPPFERADRLLNKDGPRRAEFRSLYNAGSKAIHSSHEEPGYSPLKYLEEVLSFVGNEYAINLRA